MFSKGSMWMMSRDSNFSFWLGNWTKSRCGKTVGSSRVRVGSIESLINRVTRQVKLTRIFRTFFFFKIDAICQLNLSSLTMIRFSLVILLPLTNYH